MSKIEQYIKVFGDIVFPEEGCPSEERLKIYSNPSGYLYSEDGVRWEQAPIDIGKIDYSKVMFRKAPDGVFAGVTMALKNSPNDYEFSTNNGYTWKVLEGDINWVYHGSHSAMWFRKQI